MANTLTENVRLDGERKLVLEYQITGDGSGEESDTVLVDFSGLSANGFAEFAIQKILWSLTGFSVTLDWDATANVKAFECPQGDGGYDFGLIGGPLVNTAGTGKTGDLLISTSGLGSNDSGTIRIEGYKRG